MPMTDKDIRQLFELDGTVIKWREVPVAGLPALFLRAAQKHNQKAGVKVQFWSGSGSSKMVTVAGVAVTVDRIMKVLGAQAGKDARKAEGAKRTTGASGAAAQPQSAKSWPWDDPDDPRVDQSDGMEAHYAWLERNAERRKAWEKENGPYGK